MNAISSLLDGNDVEFEAVAVEVLLAAAVAVHAHNRRRRRAVLTRERNYSAEFQTMATFCHFSTRSSRKD